MYLRQPGFTQACNQEFFDSELGHFDEYQPTTRDRTTPRGKVAIFWLRHPEKFHFKRDILPIDDLN